MTQRNENKCEFSMDDNEMHYYTEKSMLLANCQPLLMYFSVHFWNIMAINHDSHLISRDYPFKLHNNYHDDPLRRCFPNYYCH
jgi:hypothetical protein